MGCKSYKFTNHRFDEFCKTPPLTKDLNSSNNCVSEISILCFPALNLAISFPFENNIAHCPGLTINVEPDLISVLGCLQASIFLVFSPSYRITSNIFKTMVSPFYSFQKL